MGLTDTFAADGESCPFNAGKPRVTQETPGSTNPDDFDENESDEATPQRGRPAGSNDSGEAAPQRGCPARDDSGDAAPQRGCPASDSGEAAPQRGCPASDSGEAAPQRGCPARDDRGDSNPKGTLGHRVTTGLTQQETQDVVQAAHIVLWWSKLTKDPKCFPDEIQRIQLQQTAAPLAFIVAEPQSTRFTCVHSPGRVVMEDSTHWADNDLYAFTGDRVIVENGCDRIIHDPSVIELPLANIKNLYEGATAAVSAMKTTMGVKLVEINSKSKKVKVPWIFPIPVAWIGYFLQEPKILDAYRWVADRVKSWPKDVPDFGEIAAKACHAWFRAAATRETEKEVSILAVEGIRNITPDTPLLKWTTKHLAFFLPLPPVNTVPRLPPASPESPGGVPEVTAAQMALVSQTLAATNRLLELQEQRATKETTKSSKVLDEVQLARLLGYCGLGWEERDQMPQLFPKVHAQPDKKARETLLDNFFQELGELDPSFRGFRNKELMDDLVNHRFAPGARYETAQTRL